MGHLTLLRCLYQDGFLRVEFHSIQQVTSHLLVNDPLTFLFRLLLIGHA